jgi:adenosylcobinamide-GDP ribazoletransferase
MRMPGNDRALAEPADIAAALGLLTRLPVPVDGARGAARGAAAAWAWPLAGLAVGALGAAAGGLALALGLTPGVAAGVVLAAQVMVTGAMHEDGLADAADGLWGGWDRARRLEIMKDSRIGTYGVMALLITGLMRWSALAAVLAAGAHWPVLLAVGALSRLPMVALSSALPNARGSGLSQAVGRPGARTLALAAVVALAPGLLLMGGAVLSMLVLAMPLCLALAWIARRKIGGQTGDILGASQQLAEVVALAAAAAWLA